MTSDLKAWQRSAIRNSMANYRRAQENYYIKGKPLVDLENGYQAFSLLTPPLGSPAARRRVRLIVDNMTQSNAAMPGARPATLNARTLHVITVAATYNCQCDCLHCSAAFYKEEVTRNRNALSLGELQDAVRQAVDLGATCVVLTGGEPLLYEGIYELIASVDPARSVCPLFTNGEFLTERTVEKLKQAGIYGVFVSVDHADAARHDQNRQRPGLSKRISRGLALCQQAKILTGISTYATREKIRDGELDALMDLAKSLKVLEVFIFDVIPTGRLSAQRECMLADEEAEQLREFRRIYNEKPEYPHIIHQTMFSSIAYPCVAEGCPAGMVQVHLRANGDVAPCDFTPHSFGNIRQRSLGEIWEAMTKSSLYAQPSARCRLSQPDFWTKLDAINTVQ
jgi:MoaA/NifB/PqqE/SkfB family radical SAM enzyme